MSPVLLDRPAYRERIGFWLRYYLPRLPPEWDIILLDNGSDVRVGQEFVARYGGRVQLVRMPIEYRRGTDAIHSSDYLYSWRAVYALGPLFLRLMEYDRVFHVESDFFIISPRMWEWAKNVGEGWQTVWVPKYNWPESGFQVLCKGCQAYDDFTAGDWKEHNGKVMEPILPFTNTNREFVGDRYSERGIFGVPENVDYVANMRNEDMPVLSASYVLDNTIIERWGDFLGTIPATVAMAARGSVTLHVHPNAAQYAALIPKSHGIEIVADGKPVYNATHRFDLHGTAVWSHNNKLYMSQAFFRSVGLPIPRRPPRAALELEDKNKVPIVADVGLAPFSRSLNKSEIWPRERWQQLVDEHQQLRFVVYGVGGLDDPDAIVGPNVTPFFGYTPEQTAMSIRDLKTCLISVVTGLSHVAFAVRQLNIVLTHQGSAWGNIPEGIRIPGPIDTLAVSTVSETLERVLAGERITLELEPYYAPAIVNHEPPGKPRITDGPVDRLIPGWAPGVNVWIDGFGPVPNDLRFLRDHHFRALGLTI